MKVSHFSEVIPVHFNRDKFFPMFCVSKFNLSVLKYSVKTFLPVYVTGRSAAAVGDHVSQVSL